MPPPLTRDDLRRHSPFAWFCLAVLAAVAGWFWLLDRHNAAGATLLGLAGCLGVILPPRERMGVLPAPVRALPRWLDAAPVLATLLSSPGYGLGWFYGANPYDEIVHLVNGGFAGAAFAALLGAARPGHGRAAARLALLGLAFGLALAVAWEVFEWATGLIGDWTDTWTDVALTASGAAVGAALTGAWHDRRRHAGAPLGSPAE